MTKQEEQLAALQDIKNLMEKSTKFISLSGLSGISVGILALCGAGYAYWQLGYANYNEDHVMNLNAYYSILSSAIVTLVGSVILGFYFTKKKADRLGQKLFDKTALRLLYNMLVPLVVGGILCIMFLFKGYLFVLAPLTLIFYGLALFNAGNLTVPEVKYLGITEIILGFLALTFINTGLLFWAIGFGVMHIIYGIVMYRKYDY